VVRWDIESAEEASRICRLCQRLPKCVDTVCVWGGGRGGGCLGLMVSRVLAVARKFIARQQQSNTFAQTQRLCCHSSMEIS
jgi:hypothetical protein